MSPPRQVRLEHRDGGQWLVVESWGPNSVRVRAGRGPMVEVAGALGQRGNSPSRAEFTSDRQRLVNGALLVELQDGLLTFRRSADGAELLAETPAHFAWPGSRLFRPVADDRYTIEQRFRAYDDEQIFGLGQHQHGRLDQKGMVLDLIQRNAEVSIPFVVSSRGYGLLWNLPALGRVEFAVNGTRWVADSARQIDYWVTTGDGPADILRQYADATGHPPMLPAWAAGFWQSKLRYTSQEELLEVAREHRRRGLPLDVIVVDYYHWTHLGDWRFDPQDWPDPRAMVEELAAMGVRLMVSVWPSLSPLSENYAAMRDQGLLIATEQGLPVHHLFPDKGFGDQRLGVSFYDATNPEARDHVWRRVREGYFDLGIRLWWLDGCEPEMYPEQAANLRFHLGPGREVANLYPREHLRGFYEHMRAEGESEVACLTRSAWAGSQRYGAILWSGDIGATFAALRAQVRAGLNAAMSGIPWWTTDIGGFHGGDCSSPGYRELVVRWFQYAVFCPVLRLHGHREPRDTFAADHSGGPTEIWAFGPEAYELLAAQLRLRERLKPYLLRQMEVAAGSGLPPMRPLLVDFPHDRRAWAVEDQFMLGPALLVAPVLVPGPGPRAGFLPDGVTGVDVGRGARVAGGRQVEVATSPDRIPVFARAGADVLTVWGRTA